MRYIYIATKKDSMEYFGTFKRALAYILDTVRDSYRCESAGFADMQIENLWAVKNTNSKDKFAHESILGYIEKRKIK